MPVGTVQTAVATGCAAVGTVQTAVGTVQMAVATVQMAVATVYFALATVHLEVATVSIPAETVRLTAAATPRRVATFRGGTGIVPSPAGTVRGPGSGRRQPTATVCVQPFVSYERFGLAPSTRSPAGARRLYQELITRP